MRTPKFRVFWVFLALVIFTSSATHGQNLKEPKLFTDKLEDEFLGLHLGCSLEELQGVLKKSANTIKLIKKDVLHGMTTYTYWGNHRLNDATATTFSFWDGKLSVVFVSFESEQAEKIYDALKMKMEEKYGKMNDRIKFAGKKCKLIKGGMGLTLELETNPFETNAVSLGAVHLAILAAKKAKEIEKKADDLGDL